MRRAPRAVSLTALVAAWSLVTPGAVASLAGPPVLALDAEGFREARGEAGTLAVRFATPWCGACKANAPVWVQLARFFEADERVRVAEVDCDASKELCKEMDVRKYPTFRTFTAGVAGPPFSKLPTVVDLKRYIEAAEAGE